MNLKHINILTRLKTTQNSRGVEKRVPNVVDIYNRKMGGVDLADQHIQVYDPDFRSVKLWKKLLVNMILRVICIAFRSSFVLKTHKKSRRFCLHMLLYLKLLRELHDEYPKWLKSH
jgi:hypothetical protein